MSVQISMFDERELKSSKVAARVDEIVGGRFDLRKFVENFPTLADADGGTGRLREMVLGLAVRGLLVPQIADEESVDAVLAKLGRASEKCEDDPKREKELRVGLGTPPEPPWSVPSAWCFVRLEETSAGGGLFCDGDWVESKDQDPTGTIRLTQLADVGDGVWRDRSNRYMNRPTADRLRCTYLEVGDILIARMPDPIGRACIFPGDKKSCATVVDVAVLRIRQEFFVRRYVMMAVNSKPVRDHINTLIAGTTRQRISRSNLAKVVIPLPPLAEQKRIVAKVDQLMALCDDLEARQAKKRETAVRLNRAALDALTTAEGPEEVAASFRRVADNFETLVYAPESVGELRKAILRLGSRGRLVKQDPKEAPASGVLLAVSRRREELLKTRRVSTSESLPPVTEKEAPFSLPDRWIWARLADVTVCRDGERVPVSKDERAGRKGSFDYYGASGVIDSIDGFLFDGSLLLIGEDGANLINRSTPIAFIAAGKYWVNNHAHVLDGASLESLRYIAMFINAIDLVPYVTGTAQPKMNQAKMNSIPIAVPPLAEQARIVAKLDQLMALCDTLEAALRRAESTAQKLAEAVVAELVA